MKETINQKYHNLLKDILSNGIINKDRTGDDIQIEDYKSFEKIKAPISV